MGYKPIRYEKCCLAGLKPDEAQQVSNSRKKFHKIMCLALANHTCSNIVFEVGAPYAAMWYLN